MSSKDELLKEVDQVMGDVKRTTNVALDLYVKLTQERAKVAIDALVTPKEAHEILRAHTLEKVKNGLAVRYWEGGNEYYVYRASKSDADDGFRRVYIRAANNYEKDNEPLTYILEQIAKADAFTLTE